MTKQRKLIVIKLYSRIVRSAFVFVIVCHSSTSFNLQFILSVIDLTEQNSALGIVVISQYSKTSIFTI